MALLYMFNIYMTEYYVVFRNVTFQQATILLHLHICMENTMVSNITSLVTPNTYNSHL